MTWSVSASTATGGGAGGGGGQQPLLGRGTRTSIWRFGGSFSGSMFVFGGVVDTMIGKIEKRKKTKRGRFRKVEK